MIAIINGPNINLLGIREPEIYGDIRWEEIQKNLEKEALNLNIELICFQSNYEGAIVDFIQENLYEIEGVVINPASFTISGYSIVDALEAIHIPFVEVHMSNIFSRGGWHSESVFAEKAVGHICGFKENVYYLGLKAITSYLKQKRSKNNE